MTILEKILNHKKSEVEIQKSISPLIELKQKIDNPQKSYPFLRKLKSNREEEKISLIAEVKKASPSKGVIREDFHPVEIALQYENAGASAISVLTDEEFFQGKIQYLKDVKNAVKIPVLRKDFIIDEYQIWQTKEMGADIILLIASALEKKQLADFYALSQELGLDVLLEVHDSEEMNTTLEIGANIIGINNRNLKTFEISLDNTINLLKDIKLNDKYFISESGIFTNNDVKLLQSCGVDGILVGESLIKSNDIDKSVKSLLQ